MGFFFVRSGWDGQLDDAIRKDNSELRIICPFIKKSAAARLLNRGVPAKMLVLTRASLNDFYGGVSDIGALKLLQDSGAEIRVVRNLHTKLYLFGKSRVILTSANLTDKALRSNHEFGFVSDTSKVVRDCTQYFNDLWQDAGKSLSDDVLAKWQREITKHTGKAGNAQGPNLPDYGTEVEQFREQPEPLSAGYTDRAWVKFFGEGHNRSAHSDLVFDEIKRSGCHWACTYPTNKRPRSVRDGDVMFMGRLVQNRKDILVFGRAVATRYRRGVDDASPSDIKQRPWKKRWPHYIRVHNSEFVSGALSNGVSLKRLMKALGSDSFFVTQRNAARGKGNIEPRKSLMQQAAVRLAAQGNAWLTIRLEEAFQQHGKLTRKQLDALDWPE
jgi:HKD family nuclease